MFQRQLKQLNNWNSRLFIHFQTRLWHNIWQASNHSRCSRRSKILYKLPSAAIAVNRFFFSRMIADRRACEPRWPFSWGAKVPTDVATLTPFAIMFHQQAVPEFRFGPARTDP